MERIKNFIAAKKLAFYIALAYVGFGTLSVCSIYPADLFFGYWSLLGFLITFPVTVLSFGYRYADSQNLNPVPRWVKLCDLNFDVICASIQ